ncbi:AtuA-related protein [Sphingomonas sp. MMS24-JH45]
MPLIRLAWARSGNKGGLFNVGVIAPVQEYLPFIAVPSDGRTVCDWFARPSTIPRMRR